MLWIVMGFIFLAILIMSFFQFLYYLLHKKYKQVYIAFGNEDYYRVIDKLKNNGIVYKVKIITNQRSNDLNPAHSSQYEIYVKDRLEQKALSTIHSAV
ncbi:hypothetical protein GH741_07810 [Aquibacillus halophilus]|uniref:DUF2007 domain-containing protein n=1 Tax=Aquibacillus halophilus TaxID=930132 RepID=A0A6A8DAG1_9BACI|nr:hypothetical protein [Aquibacillus halophilus]MRH42588.1 hypothetical protein [Aquibacillus halophilus]